MPFYHFKFHQQEGVRKGQEEEEELMAAYYCSTEAIGRCGIGESPLPQCCMRLDHH